MTTTTESKTKPTQPAARPEPRHSTPKRMHLMRYWTAIVGNKMTDAAAMAQNYDVTRADREKATKYIEWHKVVQAGPPSESEVDKSRAELTAAHEAVDTAKRALNRAEEATDDPPTPDQWRAVVKAEAVVKEAEDRTNAAIKQVNAMRSAVDAHAKAKHQLALARRHDDVDTAYIIAALDAQS